MVILGDVPHKSFALSSQIWNVSIACGVPRSTFTIDVSSYIESAFRETCDEIFDLLNCIARFFTHRDHEAERRHVSTIQLLLWSTIYHVSRKDAGTNRRHTTQNCKEIDGRDYAEKETFSVSLHLHAFLTLSKFSLNSAQLLSQCVSDVGHSQCFNTLVALQVLL